MNKELSEFARSTLKKGLKQLTKKQQGLFKRMYASWSRDVSITMTSPTEEMLSIDIDKVVDEMLDENLDWAMIQVDNTVSKNER